ncbi:MAG: DsrE family protein [Methanosarcinaceae archaeon]|nr:DsrE family protein [Methanosarcinaceae archaeon]MCL7411515.1 DsrE family protein [Methanosarcinaceae archaeon]MDF1533044.1 DsrE family protein [Methanosarcinaceae archaeon]
MVKVKKVLLLLKNMVYESTSPQETLRFAKYYRKKGLEVIVVLWGPMGVVLGKKNKHGSPEYDNKMQKCIDLGVQFKCCELAASMIGLKEEELMPGVEMIHSHEVAEMFLQFREEGQLIINL